MNSEIAVIHWISLSLRFNGHFPGGPGLASTRMYTFWILLGLRVMEVVVTTIRHVKLQSIVTTNKPTPSFFTGRMPFLSPNQQCQSAEGKCYSLDRLANNISLSVRVNVSLSMPQSRILVQKQIVSLSLVNVVCLFVGQIYCSTLKNLEQYVGC